MRAIEEGAHAEAGLNCKGGALARTCPTSALCIQAVEASAQRCWTRGAADGSIHTLNLASRPSWGEGSTETFREEEWEGKLSFLTVFQIQGVSWRLVYYK